MRKIDLYQESATTSVGEITDNLKKSIGPKTRFVALTYVDSSTGVKLPIKEIAAVIQELNHSRDQARRIYLCVDAVHAFGIENFRIQDLGCDFLAAGTHKWLFGPRGTGILYGKEDAWDVIDPVIPPYSVAYNRWIEGKPIEPISFFQKMTPGGFHSFEHRWALKEAFHYHLEIGKNNIQTRTHYLNTLLKEGMSHIPHIIFHTPYSSELSAGIVCFEVKGMSAKTVIQKLKEAKIIGSMAPSKQIFARLTPSILNTEEDIVTCISVLENMRN
ncbi:MAG: aminotransferase class V-fold PLP-dependent enzyme [Bacteroidia bacterium]